MTNLRDRQKAATREAILDAAAAAFAEHGYEGTTFSVIAAEMGRPKSAIGYHQFATKDQIAAAIVERQWATWQRMIDVLADRPAGLVRLLGLMKVAAKDIRDSATAKAAVRLILEREAIGVPLPIGRFTWRAFAVEQLEHALADGSLPAGNDPDDVARRLISASFGVYALENSGFQPIDTQRNLRGVWADLLGALGVANASDLLDEARRIADETVVPPA